MRLSAWRNNTNMTLCGIIGYLNIVKINFTSFGPFGAEIDNFP